VSTTAISWRSIARRVCFGHNPWSMMLLIRGA
jgi:hypothetical protein